MVSYLNLSNHLDERRQEAKASGGQGPRVVVLGPMDSGKSTLVRMLANWAVRKGWQPTVVDVDVGGWVRMTCGPCMEMRLGFSWWRRCNIWGCYIKEDYD